MKHSLIRVLLLLAATTLARADAVLDWNAIAAQTIAAAARPGGSAALDFATVQAAVHDAVQAYEKTFQPYATDISGATGSPAAAVAKATRDVLVNRFPSQATTINTAYTTYFANNSLAADDAGVAIGAQAAAGLIAGRTGDGAFPNPSPIVTGANVVGVWRPTPSLLPGAPPSFSPFGAVWLGDVTPFVILDSDQFAPDAPDAVTSGVYTRDYNETKALGSLNSTIRTPEQTQLGYFFADNTLILVNRILRTIATSQLDNSGDRARLFALAWLSAADGVITAWAAKLQHPTWRPITAIREGDSDGNRHTVGDPDWQPLINTPNYPDHASGANTVIGGMTQMLKMFMGTDKITFDVTSNHPNANPKVRTYSRFSDVSLDVVEVRIYQGIHFRGPDRDGRECGRAVARYVYENALRPFGE